jgi:pyrroline-5-carboxylate reductase
MKISFIGGGNMARALIGGLINKGVAAKGIQVIEPNAEAREKLSADFDVRCIATLDDAFVNCETILLAIKPQQMREALIPLSGRLEQQLVLSIAAGIRLDDISRWLGGYRKLIRTMPNTPALIGQGVTGLFADASVDETARRDAEQILSAAGTTLWLDKESQVDAVTAISGSGPAYVFYFIEALEAAAIEQGFTADAARRLAMQTFAGSVALAERSQESVSTLRQQVTSKGGTTEAALRVFAEREIAASIGLGVNAAADRGRELGEAMGHD